jgi:hypothetical protein
VIPVEFNSHIKELFETVISNNEKENKKLQKTIANTVIGLLSKSINKNTKVKDI